MSSTLEFAQELIRCPSVTPDDAGCQALIARRLESAGFATESLVFGKVTNLWARRGSTGPVFCFAGHTDVVPPGSTADWLSDPFDPQIQDGILSGRGAADMKSALAAMVDSATAFADAHPNHSGSLAFLITSDEEGRARDGTKRVIDALELRGEHIDMCVIGEPTSSNRLGDTVKIGRRGSLSGLLTIRGVEGHVAYPELASNPIESFAPVLAELYSTRLDEGNDHFPPSSFQVVMVESGSEAPNVTPGELKARFNFRYSTEWNHDSLQRHVEQLLTKHGLQFSIDWHLSGQPFVTEGGELIAAVRDAVQATTGLIPELSTSGGTSDGRFIAPAGAQVVEFGAVNSSIHKPNEQIPVGDIDLMRQTYASILERMLL